MGRLNEIAPVAAVKWPLEDMRAWCGRHNQTAFDMKFSRWLYVSQDKETGTNSIKVREGADALDVTKLMDGWYPDFMGWEPERLDREFRILRKMLRMGMPEEEYQKLCKAVPALPRPMPQLNHATPPERLEQ